MRLRTLGIALVLTVWSTTDGRAQGTQIEGANLGDGVVTQNVSGPAQGQAFVAPTASTYLDRFSFWTPTSGAISSILMSLWDYSPGTTTLGAASLWTGSFGSTTPGRIDVALPQVPVTPGNFYAFMIEMASTTGGVSIYYFAGPIYLPADALTHTGTPTGGATVTPINYYDWRFEARFNQVPEPATFFLLATGILGIGGVTLVRRRKQLG